MISYIGIDGCKGGWLVCHWDGSTISAPYLTFLKRIDLLDLSVITTAAIDIPIGFPDKAVPGGRSAEQEVRRFLVGKSSSVFSAPCRPALKANNFGEALSENRKHSDVKAVGLSLQSAAIIPKMREVDEFITTELQKKLFESHPEVAFAIMNGRQPVLSKKRKAEGRADRMALLRKNGFPLDNLLSPTVRPKRWSQDDTLDACACAWVAKRIHSGEFCRFPSKPPIDAKGLRMEINA